MYFSWDGTVLKIEEEFYRWENEEKIIEKIQYMIDWIYREHDHLNYDMRPRILLKIEHNDNVPSIWVLFGTAYKIEKLLNEGSFKEIKKELPKLLCGTNILTGVGYKDNSNLIILTFSEYDRRNDKAFEKMEEYTLEKVLPFALKTVVYLKRG